MDLVNNSNFALYLFLFLSLLSVGNDVYAVYLTTMDTEFVKNQKEKFSTYIKLFEDLLCNKVKKVKNKLIFEKDKQEFKEETKKTNKVETNKESKEETNIDETNINETNKEETNQEECNEESKKTKEKIKIEKKKKKKIRDENNIIDKKSNNDYENNINILKKIVKKEN